MYSPIRRNTRKQGNTSAFDRKLSSSNARKIDNNKRRREQRRRQTRRSWCKNKKGHADLKRHQNAIIRKNLSGQIVANAKLQNKQHLPTVFDPCFSYNPHYGFFCQANSKAPKVEQVFSHATCNNHSFVVSFVDWSIMKLMLQIGKVQL